MSQSLLPAPPTSLFLPQALLTSQGSSAAATVLTFGQVTLSGFLSFADRVSYPLDARGVVVLTGSVDGQGRRAGWAWRVGCMPARGSWTGKELRQGRAKPRIWCIQSLNAKAYHSASLQEPCRTTSRPGSASHPLIASGFQSNGAGKSALAMSSLWCLTGGMDARSEVSLAVARIGAVRAPSSLNCQ